MKDEMMMMFIYIHAHHHDIYREMLSVKQLPLFCLLQSLYATKMLFTTSQARYYYISDLLMGGIIFHSEIIDIYISSYQHA